MTYVRQVLQCRKLHTIDLSHNKIELPDDEPYKMILMLEPMKALRSLDLTGNPAKDSFNHYREVHVEKMPEALEILDRQVITPQANTCIDIWLCSSLISRCLFAGASRCQEETNNEVLARADCLAPS